MIGAALALMLATAGAAAQSPGGEDAADLEHRLQVALEEVRKLKNGNRSKEALVVIEATLADAPPRGAMVCRLLCHGAEILRQLRRWDESEAWLQRASPLAEAVADATARASLLRYLDVQWGLLDWSRGLPDLAFEAVERLRRRPPADSDEARDTCMLEVLVLRALGYEPTAGLHLVQEFEATYGRNHDLRVRAAAMVIDQQAPAADDLALARQWFEAAAADAQLTARERDIARIFNLIGSLNAGDLALAATQIEQLERSLRDAGAEPPVNVPALALRHAIDAQLDREVVQARYDQALAVWRNFLTTWARQNPTPRGLGPLAAADRQRLFSELLRARMWLAPGEAGVLDAVQLLLEAESHGTMARSVAAPAGNAATLASTLPPANGGVVAYVAGPDRTWAFTIERGGVHAFELPVKSLALEREARHLTDVLQTWRIEPARGRLEVLAATERLAASLLPPALGERLHGWHELVIVGLESLGYVPFELLRPPAAPRLGESHAISYWPSLVIGDWLRHRDADAPPPAEPEAVLTACPDARGDDTTADASPLPFAAAEQRGLVDDAGAARFFVLRGADGTLAASAARMHGATYWAIVAHGVRNDRRLDPQGVRMGDGRVAWAADFEALALPPVVFFGSCRAGRGRLRRGDDGRHLLHGAAMLAGARAVVTPWLDVDYRATLALMSAAHRALFVDGAPLDEALRRARCEVARELGDDELTPFLFHVHGLGGTRTAVAQPRRSQRLFTVVALAGVGALLAASWWLRRRR